MSNLGRLDDDEQPDARRGARRRRSLMRVALSNGCRGASGQRVDNRRCAREFYVSLISIRCSVRTELDDDDARSIIDDYELPSQSNSRKPGTLMIGNVPVASIAAIRITR